MGVKISFLPPDLYAVQYHTCHGVLFEGYTILQGMKLSVQLGRKGSVLCLGQSIYDTTKKAKRRTALRVPPLEPAVGAERSIGEVELSFCVLVGRKMANSIRGTCLFAGGKVFALGVHAFVVVDILQDQYQLQVNVISARGVQREGRTDILPTLYVPKESI